MGGEEFLIVLRSRNVDKVDKIDLRLNLFKNKIEESHLLVNIDGKEVEIKVTITIGYCVFNHNLNVYENIANADKALYYGKRNGRNIVVNYSSIST